MANTQLVLTSAQEFVSSAQGVLNRMTPKIEAATGDLAEIAQGLRVQTAEIQSTAMEIVDKVRKQGNRLDEMCTGLLNTVDRAGGIVTNAVSAPVRQICEDTGDGQGRRGIAQQARRAAVILRSQATRARRPPAGPGWMRLSL